jgi:hypothetical protein
MLDEVKHPVQLTRSEQFPGLPRFAWKDVVVE